MAFKLKSSFTGERFAGGLREQLSRASNLTEQSKQEFETIISQFAGKRGTIADIKGLESEARQIGQDIESARLGIGSKYRSRQLLNEKQKIAQERPGRAQTLLGGSQRKSTILG